MVLADLQQGATKLLQDLRWCVRTYIWVQPTLTSLATLPVANASTHQASLRKH